MFDYWKSDNKYDNSNRNIIKQIVNNLFSDFQGVNRMNSQDNNNRFLFDMNNNHSNQPYVSRSQNENLLINWILNE